jgi:hypothetical protein
MAFGDAAWADAALLHDELEPFNSPVWFHEFVEHAEQHDLEFLAEAMFPDVMHSEIDAAVLDAAQQRATSRIDFEQQLDFLTQTMFRRSLLVRRGTPFDQRLRSSRVFGLTVASEVREAEPDEPGGPPAFLLPDNRRFSFPHPLTSAAMQHLAQISPQSVPFTDLAAAAEARIGVVADETERNVLAANLIKALGTHPSLVDLRADRPTFVIEPGERPCGSPVARLLAPTGPTLANLRHERIELDDEGRRVLVAADGTADRAEIAARAGLDLANTERVLRWLARVALLQA